MVINGCLGVCVCVCKMQESVCLCEHICVCSCVIVKVCVLCARARIYVCGFVCDWTTGPAGLILHPWVSPRSL